jgi:hypothetical protein
MPSKDYESGYRDAVFACFEKITDIFLNAFTNNPEIEFRGKLINTLTYIIYDFRHLTDKFKDESNEQSKVYTNNDS